MTTPDFRPTAKDVHYIANAINAAVERAADRKLARIAVVTSDKLPGLGFFFVPTAQDDGVLIGPDLKRELVLQLCAEGLVNFSVSEVRL